jgi:hypothetical protein
LFSFYINPLALRSSSPSPLSLNLKL